MFSHQYKWIFPGLLGIYSFFNILILDGDRLFQAALPQKQLFILILVLCYLVWGINFLIESWILPKITKIHPLVFQFFASFILISGVALLSVEVTGVLFGGPFGLTRPNFLLTLGFLFRINLFLNSVNAIYFFNKKYGEKKLEAERLKLLSTEAKLESLNMQLNPHFFFNNLSALSVLIHENVQLADTYLHKLSGIYRYLLNNNVHELVTLEDELEFLNDYLDLLAIRFEKSLSFDINIQVDVKKKMVPPAVLQLLVENAVKHNYFTEEEPLEIRIEAVSDKLKISNLKQLKEALEESTGIGLQNISERYRFLNQSIEIKDGEQFFQVTLPLIEIYETTVGRRRTPRTTTD
ncbi:signal transduction histidine kinase [Algoriphagus kandeliae]|uniref:Signal transduction histidine kinase n=1 Tax=Algoriphagus kandeliae TaxID=2562278 RepID=A0A4Y9QZ72_9BACT|nr:histidine kinase [Algoriphagus kandeliae]TFV97370.1 signal transduction histidine kinase [Algoriphagus kandeliae]